MIQRFLRWRGSVFTLVFAWKIALFVISAQPVPANDSFYFDGPIIHFLSHGRYINPSIALALPISGKEVFCCYPPLYELVLLPWVAVFGGSALAAIAFHLVVFGFYLLVLFAVMRQLQLPAWCMHVAGAFLFLISFHDRPDALAQVFGLLSVYALVRFLRTPDQGRTLHAPNAPTLLTSASPRWLWLAAAFTLLAFCTSLQLGAFYSLLLWLAALIVQFARPTYEPQHSVSASIPSLGVGGSEAVRAPLHIFSPLLTLTLIEIGLLALVAFGFPRFWAGFMEAGRQAPSLGGWRIPQPFELLRIARTTPGLLAVVAFVPWLLTKHQHARRLECELLWRMTMITALTGAAILMASLFLLSDGSIIFGIYLQPLMVGCLLAFVARLAPAPQSSERSPAPTLHALTLVFVTLAALGSLRALGMTTWGLICARDVGYSASLARVRQEIRAAMPGERIAFSAAYLYEAERHDEINWVHCNWLDRAHPRQPGAMRDALIKARPAKLILTQLDYYYFYEPILAELQSRPELVQFQTTNLAKVPTPDSIKPVRKFIQHVSWAPVIVTLSWKAGGIPRFP